MKIFKTGLKMLFAISLIFELIGCTEKEDQFSFENPCPNGKLVILSVADFNKHGAEISICDYSNTEDN
ncbi:MAG: hypothetical protein KAJ10_10175 [Thermodesulfovibrionia bacterium]|nr:hypothetical protein [Thermodesulfovibrionia bacterium]